MADAAVVEAAVTFVITGQLGGYAHTTLRGTYTGPASVKDVEKQFFHPYFGGREAWAKDGEWGCVVHTD